MISQSKSETRGSLKKILGSLSKEDKDKKSEKVSLNLKILLAQRGLLTNCVLGSFFPLEDEPSWFLEVKDLIGIEFAFPLSNDGKKLEFVKSGFNKLVVKRDFGVPLLGPLDGPVIVPDAILVPGQGFTRRGNRLGRGKGYYDKYLKDFKGPKIGICFVEQIQEEIPFEEHDEKVDVIVTDRSIIETN